MGRFWVVGATVPVARKRGDCGTGRATGDGRPYGDGVDVDFDFNILTAFIRLGRAGPVGAGCPPYYYFYYLTLTFLTLTLFYIRIRIIILR
jgi:hypothetical protein